MLIHPEFDPVALQIGPIAIRWYGLMYLIAFAAFYLLGRWRVLHTHHGVSTGLKPSDVEDLLFYGVLGVVLGGRLGYCLFYKPAYYLQHPLEVFAVWQGGMAFHGGLLGVIAACYLFAARRRLPFVQLMDFVAPLVPLGLASGRLGNFINGELWGRATDLPWAMVFPQSGTAIARHPS
ncbi:MAG: prolipoprotein diacylglyceryl transferase, partial [Burkholderiaceae bacterium]